METKPLAYGLVGFFIGGLIVSVAATTLEKPQAETPVNEVSMTQMTGMLRDLKGDEFDAAFISYMIDHHQSAVDMAELSESRASHAEIKRLSKDIISAQQKEIAEMKQWRVDWNLPTPAHSMMMH